MPPLVWDEQLVQDAKVWAEGCPGDHDHRNLGRLNQGGQGFFFSLSLVVFLRSWFRKPLLAVQLRRRRVGRPRCHGGSQVDLLRKVFPLFSRLTCPSSDQPLSQLEYRKGRVRSANPSVVFVFFFFFLFILNLFSFFFPNKRFLSVF